jgi:hypothetical protein
MVVMPYFRLASGYDQKMKLTKPADVAFQIIRRHSARCGFMALINGALPARVRGILFFTKEEAEAKALVLCKAWIDERIGREVSRL